MAFTRPSRAALAAALLLAAGCDVTLPWSEGSAPETGHAHTPSGLVATADAENFDLVQLSWSAMADVDYYEIEARVGAGSWQPLGSLPGEMSSWPVWLDPTTPELTSLAFRLRSRVGGSVSGWSSEAPLPRGIRPPTTFEATAPQSNLGRVSPVKVTWTNASLVATDVALERALLDAPSGNPIAWVPVAGASLAAGSYTDDLVDEGNGYAYRIRVGAGGTWSIFRLAQTPPIDLVAPSGLRAFVDGSVVRLTWTNRSAKAEKLTVTRYTLGWPSWDFMVDLAPTDATWTEPMPVWPVVSYSVGAARPSEYLYAESALRGLEPFTLPGPPALAASPRSLPAHEFAVRDAAGRYHLAHHQYETPRLHRETATGYDTHLLSGGVVLVMPGVVLDGLGGIHTLFLRGAGPGVYDFVHTWWDGSAWQEEVVATDDLSAAWFGVDAAGGLQLAYLHPTGTGSDALLHVARSGGNWVTTTVATPSVPDLWRYYLDFAVAADGVAQVALLGQSASLAADLMVLCTRSSSGAWSDETVPSGGFDFGGPWVAAGNGGAVAIGFFAGGGTEARVIRKVGGTWGMAELAMTRPFDGYPASMRLAATPDLGRVAFLAASNSELGVHARASPAWQHADLGPSTETRGVFGFDPSGRAWALVPNASASFAPVFPHSLYEEVP